MEPTRCSFKGCKEPRRYLAVGLCGGHYQQQKTGRPLKPLGLSGGAVKRRKSDVCAFRGCEHVVLCKKLCTGHYEQLKRVGRLSTLHDYRVYTHCTFPECNRPHEAKGFCKQHARQKREGKKNMRLVSAKNEVRPGPLLVLTNRQGDEVGTARVSRVDLDRVLAFKHRWTPHVHGYVVGGRTKLHRFVMDVTDPTIEVDHKNGVRSDCRRSNLRLVRDPQQSQNRKGWGQSGHRNVYWEEHKKLWRVVVGRDGKKYSGGRHRHLRDAVKAAKRLRAKLFTHAVESRHPLPAW